MRMMPKEERQKVRQEYIRYRNREFKSVAKQAAKEYGRIGAGVVDEIGFLFTGVRAKTPKKR